MDIFRTSLFDNEIMKNDIKSDYRVNRQFEFLGIIIVTFSQIEVVEDVGELLQL